MHRWTVTPPQPAWSVATGTAWQAGVEPAWNIRA